MSPMDVYWCLGRFCWYFRNVWRIGWRCWLSVRLWSCVCVCVCIRWVYEWLSEWESERVSEKVGEWESEWGRGSAWVYVEEQRFACEVSASRTVRPLYGTSQSRKEICVPFQPTLPPPPSTPTIHHVHFSSSRGCRHTRTYIHTRLHKPPCTHHCVSRPPLCFVYVRMCVYVCYLGCGDIGRE